MSEQDPSQPPSEQASGAESTQTATNDATTEQPSITAATESENVSTSMPPTADPATTAPIGESTDPSGAASTGADASAAETGSPAAGADNATGSENASAAPESSKPKSDLGSKAGKSNTSKQGSNTGNGTKSKTGASSTTGPDSAVSKAMSGTGGSKANGSRIRSSTSKTGGSTTGGGGSTRSHHSTTRTSTTATSSTTSSQHKASSAGAPAAGGAAGSNRKRVKLGELDLSTARIGFLGAGKIAESTINGLIHYGKISPSRIYVAAPSSKGLERFKALGCRVTKRNYDIFGRYDCDIVFLAFHGYVIKHCYKLGGLNRPHPLCTNYIPHQRHPVYIMSMVSGVSLGQIRQVLLNPENPSRYVVELHRIMVNTAVGHGLGLCAIDCEPDSKKLSAPIRQLLSSIAQLEHVPATQMDAACAIGGSGLAFSYYFINALADGAFRMGLSRAQAIRFASKTAQCAAQTMLESGKHPAELRDNVSAPSGAAIYGIHVLEKNDVASGVTAAVEAAHKRAHDLATQDVTAQ